MPMYPAAAVAVAAAATPAPMLLAAGMDAYAAGDFTAARRAFRALADDGSAIGETMIGTMYAHGQGVRRDPGAAAGYYFRAAQRGYAPAQLAFAKALARGDGVAIDRRAAMMWTRLAEQRGDARVSAAARREAAALRTAGTTGDLSTQVDDWRPWPSGRD